MWCLLAYSTTFYTVHGKAAFWHFYIVMINCEMHEVFWCWTLGCFVYDQRHVMACVNGKPIRSDVLQANWLTCYKLCSCYGDDDGFTAPVWKLASMLDSFRYISVHVQTKSKENNFTLNLFYSQFICWERQYRSYTGCFLAIKNKADKQHLSTTGSVSACHFSRTNFFHTEWVWPG